MVCEQPLLRHLLRAHALHVEDSMRAHLDGAHSLAIIICHNKWRKPLICDRLAISLLQHCKFTPVIIHSLAPWK